MLSAARTRWRPNTTTCVGQQNKAALAGANWPAGRLAEIGSRFRPLKAEVRGIAALVITGHHDKRTRFWRPLVAWTTEFRALRCAAGSPLGSSRPTDYRGNQGSRVRISRLAPIAPFGIGTAAVESAPSYLERVGEVHQRRARAIAELALAHESPRRARRAKSFPIAAALIGVRATRLIDALGALSGRTDLGATTFGQLERGVAISRDLRRTIWACSACLRDDTTPYLRLSWHLRAYVICPRHHLYLHECRASLAGTHARRPGACPRCGVAIVKTSLRCDEARTIDALIELGQRGQGFERARLVGALRALSAPVGIRALSAELRLSEPGLRGVIEGRARPSVASVVAFGRLASLEELLNHPAVALKPLRDQHPVNTRTDRRLVTQRLGRVARSANPTVGEAARLVGITTSTLYRHFRPELQIIVRGGRLVREARREEFMAQRKRRIAHAFAELSKAGEAPTMKAISRRLGLPSLFLRVEYRRTYLALRAGLRIDVDVDEP